MKSRVLGELRAKKNALSSMLGWYPERHLQLSTMRIAEYGLVDDWMRDNQAIFIHIPKAAGRSIQHTLEIPMHFIAHIPAEAYRRADPDFYARSYTFSIIRNPWDRIVSAFHFMFSKDTEYNAILRNIDLRGITEFPQFLNKLRNPLYRYQILSRLHFMPQTHFLCGHDGQIIVDRIGRFEALPEAFDQITEPLVRDFILQTKNRGAHKDYRDYYTHNWQVELVGKMYASDCAAFGYTFDHSPKEPLITLPSQT